MDFFITLANYLTYSLHGYKMGILYTILYLVVVSIIFYLPGKALDERTVKCEDFLGSSVFFFRIVLGLVFYLTFAGFMTTTFVTPHIWAEYQWMILVALNFLALFFTGIRDAIRSIRKVFRPFSSENGRLIIFSILLCFGAILMHSLWRPFPGDVDSQQNGYLIRMIFHHDTYPLLKPIPNLQEVYFTVSYPPSVNLFLGIFVKMGIPMEILLRTSLSGNLLLCLILFFPLGKVVFGRLIIALLAVIFSVNYVFFHTYTYQTQITETFGQIALILFMIILFTRREKTQSKVDIKSMVPLGVILGGMMFVHGRFFRWTSLAIMILFMIEFLKDMCFQRNFQKTKWMFLNFTIIAIVASIVISPWLFTVWELFGSGHVFATGFYLLKNFTPDIRTFNGFSYVRFLFFIVGGILIVWDMFRRREGDSIAKNFVFSYALMGVFEASPYKSYGNTFIQPLFIALGFVWVVETVKLSRYLKRSIVILGVVVACLLYNSWPLYSGVMTPSRGDWDDLRAMNFIADNTRHEGTLILNSLHDGAKWVTPISGRNSIFSRPFPANTTEPHRKVLNKLSRIHSDPREEDLAFLKEVGISHVIVLGSVYSFHSQALLSANKGRVLKGQASGDGTKTSAKWMRIPWVRLVEKFDSLRDGEPTFLFKLN